MRVAFLPYVMWGDSESASKNTSDPILKIRKEQFLIFPLACDLVVVLAVGGGAVQLQVQVSEFRAESTCASRTLRFSPGSPGKAKGFLGFVV